MKKSCEQNRSQLFFHIFLPAPTGPAASAGPAAEAAASETSSAETATSAAAATEEEAVEQEPEQGTAQEDPVQ